MRGIKPILKECKSTAITDLLNLAIKPVLFTPIQHIHWTKLLNLIAIAGAISAPFKGNFTMQRNANMQKI